MIESLNNNGKLIIIHSYGDDPGHEIIKKIWPTDNPFPSNSRDIVDYLKKNLDKKILKKINFKSANKIKYHLRALPNEIENGISTSFLFSSWNAVTYVGQISDDKIIDQEKIGNYVDIIKETVKNHKGVWFNDEVLEIVNKE